MGTTILPTYCALCISRCGCLATVEDGRLLRIDPDPQHPTGKSICIKARAAPELVSHPERLTQPLRRTRPKGDADPGWQAISWEEALALTASKLKAIGPAATAFAVATPSGTAITDSFGWIHRLAHLWGSPNLVFATENCNWHRDFTPQFTWGRSLGMPDWENADTLLLWGCNPATTWLAMADRISNARRRGAKLVVIDPRQAGLARQADLWLGLRPGSDTALAWGLIRELLESQGENQDFLRQYTDAFQAAPNGATNLDRLRREAAAWPLERVVSATGLSAEAIRSVTAWISSGNKTALYTWTGTCQQNNATEASRAIHLLYTLTGSLGQPGGNRWFPRPAVNDIAAFEALNRRIAPTLGQEDRPLGPPSRGWITTRDLFRAAVTEQPYPIKALVAFGGNFLVSKPATRHTDEALARLDFFAQTELFHTPSSQWADLLLPAASCWEREGLQIGFQVDGEAERHVQLRPAVACPPGEALADTAVVFRLATALELGSEFFNGSPAAGLNHVLEPSGLTAEELRRHRRGLPAPHLTQEPPPPTVRLFPPELEGTSTTQQPITSDTFPYLLTCGKTPHYCHSQFRQLPRLRKGQPEPEAEIAPDVAEACVIANGDWITIRTATGEFQCRSLVSSHLAPGTIWAHYGWWSAERSINYNAAMDGESFDRVAGSNALRGIPCHIERAYTV